MEQHFEPANTDPKTAAINNGRTPKKRSGTKGIMNGSLSHALHKQLEKSECTVPY
jgi:hypothetical protein